MEQKTSQNQSENVKNLPFATEMLHEVKWSKKLLSIVAAIEGALIVLLFGALIGLNIYHNNVLAEINRYHEELWSQFDTIVVDSGDGAGSANYVDGNNAGGIFNGTGSGQTPEGQEEQGKID